MSKYIELTSKDFDKQILKGVSLVEFWAPWCGPCRMIASTIEDLGEEYDGKANICKVNTDEEPNIAVTFNVRSIPNLIFFKDGKMVDQIVGAQSKKVLTEKLEKLL